MARAKRLEAAEAFRRCDPEALGFDTTADVDPLPGILGQPRAISAVEFGVGIDRPGYNIFAFGPTGTGRHTTVRQFLERRAAGRTVPPDLCYVNNFDIPDRPRLLEVPPGMGRRLRADMARLVEEMGPTLAAAVETEEYQTRRQLIDERLGERREKALSTLATEAKEKNYALLKTPAGIVFAPLRDDEPISAEDFQKLPEEERQGIEAGIEEFQEDLKKILRQFPRWQRRGREEARDLDREVLRVAVEPLFNELRESYSGLDTVLEYLEDVERDLVDSALSAMTHGDKEFKKALDSLTEGQAAEQPVFRNYRVNLLVDHGKSKGAPVVYEAHPTYQNLVGRTEQITQMGSALTDFSLIRAGALHRANGGYLIVDAIALLMHPYAWEGLKRALRSKTIEIESLGQALNIVNTYSLEPEPVPLDVKVVLVGEPHLYYRLAAVDPDFGKLFKVAADFAERLDWTADNQQLYARLIAKLIADHELQAFDSPAVARVIEHGARRVGDSKKLSLYSAKVLDLLQEAEYWAGRGDREVVTAADVETAIDAHIFRSDRLRERVQEQILRHAVLVDTTGAVVGQVNGLAVLSLGDFAFGRPSRITARVRLGKGEVVNIEREVELSGPIHSKGVLILTGFLGSRYAASTPLSLSASLVFEQSYGGIDGDSASAAELFALLSAIADLPLLQSLAVTGSVNQRGDVQVIGGVNEKIEGFFDLCAARELTGDQGVLIPAANVEHLMLRRDVVDAIADGRFHVFPMTTIDEGIEILTGLPAGEADAEGVYPEGSVNERVAGRLADLAQAAREFGSPPADDESTSKGGPQKSPQRGPAH